MLPDPSRLAVSPEVAQALTAGRAGGGRSNRPILAQWHAVSAQRRDGHDAARRSCAARRKRRPATDRGAGRAPADRPRRRRRVEAIGPRRHGDRESIACRSRGDPSPAAAAGATTVGGDHAWRASRPGSASFATGGIGGSIAAPRTSFDISADLEELGRTPVAVVCAGAKAILDLPKTLEVLETKGVPVNRLRHRRVPCLLEPLQRAPRCRCAATVPNAGRAFCSTRSRALGLSGRRRHLPIPFREDAEIPAAELASANRGRLPGGPNAPVSSAKQGDAVPPRFASSRSPAGRRPCCQHRPSSRNNVRVAAAEIAVAYGRAAATRRPRREKSVGSMGLALGPRRPRLQHSFEDPVGRAGGRLRRSLMLMMTFSPIVDCGPLERSPSPIMRQAGTTFVEPAAAWD